MNRPRTAAKLPLELSLTDKIINFVATWGPRERESQTRFAQHLQYLLDQTRQDAEQNLIANIAATKTRDST